jgi:hypothetical protein
VTLGCKVILFCRLLQRFLRKILLPSSGYEIKTNVELRKSWSRVAVVFPIPEPLSSIVDLLFCIEDGSTLFLRNFGNYLTTWWHCSSFRNFWVVRYQVTEIPLRLRWVPRMPSYLGLSYATEVPVFFETCIRHCSWFMRSVPCDLSAWIQLTLSCHSALQQLTQPVTPTGLPMSRLCLKYLSQCVIIR